MLDITLEDVFLDCLAITPRVLREVFFEPLRFFVRLRGVLVSNLPGLVPIRSLIIGRSIEFFLSRHDEDNRRVRWSEEFGRRPVSWFLRVYLFCQDEGCGMEALGTLSDFTSPVERRPDLIQSNLSTREIPGTCTVPEPNTCIKPSRKGRGRVMMGSRHQRTQPVVGAPKPYTVLT